MKMLVTGGTGYIGDVAELVASSDPIQRELDWKPRFTELRDIVANAWAWHQKFPNGYASN